MFLCVAAVTEVIHLDKNSFVSPCPWAWLRASLCRPQQVELSVWVCVCSRACPHKNSSPKSWPIIVHYCVHRDINACYLTSMLLKSAHGSLIAGALWVMQEPAAGYITEDFATADKTRWHYFDFHILSTIKVQNLHKSWKLARLCESFISSATLRGFFMNTLVASVFLCVLFTLVKIFLLFPKSILQGSLAINV